MRNGGRKSLGNVCLFCTYLIVGWIALDLYEQSKALFRFGTRGLDDISADSTTGGLHSDKDDNGLKLGLKHEGGGIILDNDGDRDDGSKDEGDSGDSRGGLKLGLYKKKDPKIKSPYEHEQMFTDTCADPKYYSKPKQNNFKNGKISSTCSATIINEDFESGTLSESWTIDGGWKRRESNMFQIIREDSELNSTKYLNVGGRTFLWQGPTYDLNYETRKCIADKSYIFEVDIRMTLPNGAKPRCYSTSNLCPELMFCYQGTHNKRKEKLKCEKLSQFHRNKVIAMGNGWYKWLDLKLKNIPYAKKGYLAKEESEAWLTISGMEPLAQVAIDNFKLYSEDDGYTPMAKNVCNDLLSDGNEDKQNFSPFPFRPMPEDEFLFVGYDEFGKYYSMPNRKHPWSAPAIDLTPGCLRNKAQYLFTGFIWIHSLVPAASRAVLQYKYKGDTLRAVIAECPVSSESIGWVKCEGMLNMERAKFEHPPYVLTFETENTQEPADWRDMIMVPIKCGDSNEQDSLVVDDTATGAPEVIEDPVDTCTIGVKVLIDAQYDQVYLKITNGISEIIESTKRYNQEPALAGTFLARVMFEFDLPDIESDWMGYIMQGDKVVWPMFTEVTYDIPSHCEGVDFNFTIIQPSIAESEVDNATYCDDLIRAGTFDNCDLSQRSSGVCHWYSSSGELRLVENGYNGTYTLSTSVRSRFSDGMLQYLDVRCLELDQKYKIEAKFQVRDMSGNVVPCDPLARPGANACPRASLRTIIEGEVLSFFIPFGKATVPVTTDGWNNLIGKFTVDSEIAQADSLAVVIDGPDAGLNIVIDDVKLTLLSVKNAAKEPGGCTENWDFEIGDSRNWDCVGLNRTCSLQMIQPGFNNSNFALGTVTRDEGWWGIDQLLDPDCFDANEIYEINAYGKVTDYNGNLVTCDPFNYFQGLPTFCPNLLLQDPDNDRYKVRSAATVGPYINGWNHIYGVVYMTEEILSWPTMVVYLGWSGPGLNIVIDEISIKPADQNTYGLLSCSQMVRNGDAEIGDARFWYIRGTGEGNYGTVEIGDDNGNKFFHHKGKRTEMRHGMWQELHMPCMKVNSHYKISAKIKLLDGTGNPKGCNKLLLGGPSARGEYGCPIFRIELYNGSGTNVVFRNYMNAELTPWNANGWNSYEHVFLLDPEMASRERFFIFVHGVMPGDTYMVDDVTVVPVNTVTLN